MKIHAETPRLILRDIELSDAEAMFEMDSDMEVHRYLGKEPVTSLQQIVDVIGFVRGQYAEFGIGRWAVVEKASGEFVGWSGLKWMTQETNGHINFYDLGYRYQRKHWGKGFATEAAQASVDYCRDVLKSETLYGMANVEHVVSRKILEKMGLSYVEDFVYDEEPHAWFKKTF